MLSFYYNILYTYEGIIHIPTGTNEKACALGKEEVRQEKRAFRKQRTFALCYDHRKGSFMQLETIDTALLLGQITVNES